MTLDFEPSEVSAVGPIWQCWSVTVYTHLHAGTITLVCVCKPEVSTGTLIHNESMNIDVNTDHTPTTRTHREKTKIRQWQQSDSDDWRLIIKLINGIANPKMDILSSFTRPCVIPNLMTFFLEWNTKEEILKNVWAPMGLCFKPYWKKTETFFKISYLVSYRRKRVIKINNE